MGAPVHRPQHPQAGKVRLRAVRRLRLFPKSIQSQTERPLLGLAPSPSSPLAWGTDCDYGHEAETNHKMGTIRLAPDANSSGSSVHLKRLISLHIQSCFPQPESLLDGSPGSAFSLCIRCGKKHTLQNVHFKKTRSNYPYWIMICSSCEMHTTRTHCFSCHRPLYKNGLQLTYHKTLADQITNIFCPACGEYFDRNM